MDYDPFAVLPTELDPEPPVEDEPLSIKLNKKDFRELLVLNGIERFLDDCEFCNHDDDDDDDDGHDHGHGHGPDHGPGPNHKHDGKNDPKKQDSYHHDPYKHDPKLQPGIDYLLKKYGPSIDIKSFDPNLPRPAAYRSQ